MINTKPQEVEEKMREVKNFVTAEQWRKLSTDDILRSIEVATMVLACKAENDRSSTPKQILRLLDISTTYQGMAAHALTVQGGKKMKTERMARALLNILGDKASELKRESRKLLKKMREQG